MLKTLLKSLILLLLLSQISCTYRSNSTKVKNLRCEYLTNPIGVDISQPRFTWEIFSNKKELSQTAYQINIASSPELLKQGRPDIFQSEKIVSSAQIAVFPESIVLKSFSQYFWNITIWINKEEEETASETASFETAMMCEKDWSSKWISDSKEKEEEAAPLFRRVFKTKEKKIDFARMYVSGLGYYEAFINGKRVGDHYLDPAYSAFDKRVYYVTHDITNLLESGNNAIGLILGNGWYNEQSVAVWNFHNAPWRNRPRMICEIYIHYKDESIDVITSDETWKTSTGSSIYNNLYSGDMIDARLEKEGWKIVDFDDTKWDNAKIISDFSPRLQSQLFDPIQITREISALSINKITDSLYIYDFGENFSGFCKIKTEGEKGTKISIKHGELLDSLGRLMQNNINVFYYPTQKKEMFQTDVYILKGDTHQEEFQPSFVYHGFQYVEVESDQPLALSKESLKAYFLHSNVKPVGSFSCSNETLNRLWEMTNRSYLSNLHSIPTDCPHREKNGWTADAHIAIEAALLNFDAITLYEKWMRDFIDNQKEKGNLSGIIPSGGWGYEDWIGPVWDAALFIVPNEIYNYYGDKRTIKELFPTMEKYLSYLKTREEDGILKYGIGDWLTFKTQTPNEFTATVYYYLDNKLMGKFAELIGEDGTAYNLKADELKKRINELFYDDKNHTYANGSQTAQALSLFAGIVPHDEEQKVADVLANIIRENKGFLDFGLLGTKTVPRMLTKYGYGDLALEMIIRPESPSWGNWVDSLNYTTLPETWKLSPQLNDASLNHVFFGDISAWMYQYLAGLNYDEKSPGFEHIRVTPYFLEGIDWVKAEYHSVKGAIRSEWKREKNNITLDVEIPAGSNASIVIGDKIHKVNSGKHTFSYNKNNQTD